MKKILILFIILINVFIVSCKSNEETNNTIHNDKEEIINNNTNNNNKKDTRLFIHYHVGDDIDETEEVIDIMTYKLKTYEKESYSLKAWYSDKYCTQAFDIDYYDIPKDKDSITLDLYGKWMEIYFKVSFMNEGELIEEQSIRYGDYAVAPKNPRKSGYYFKAWDKDFTSVKEDLIVNAVFEKSNGSRNVFVVLGNWMNDDGTISAIMKKRLDLTLEAYDKFNPAYIVVSGGMANTNAGITEAQAMYNYLTDKDIPQEIIIKEDKSLSTYQNSVYTMTLLENIDFDNLIIISTIEHFVNYSTIKYFNDAALNNKTIKDKNINIMIYTNNATC